MLFQPYFYDLWKAMGLLGERDVWVVTNSRRSIKIITVLTISVSNRYLPSEAYCIEAISLTYPSKRLT